MERHSGAGRRTFPSTTMAKRPDRGRKEDKGGTKKSVIPACRGEFVVGPISRGNEINWHKSTTINPTLSFTVVTKFDEMPVREDAVYAMNRGCVDFARSYAVHKQRAFFVVMAKGNLKFKRLYAAPKSTEAGARADQVIALVTHKSMKGCPAGEGKEVK